MSDSQQQEQSAFLRFLDIKSSKEKEEGDWKIPYQDLNNIDMEQLDELGYVMDPDLYNMCLFIKYCKCNGWAIVRSKDCFYNNKDKDHSKKNDESNVNLKNSFVFAIHFKNNSKRMRTIFYFIFIPSIGYFKIGEKLNAFDDKFNISFDQFKINYELLQKQIETGCHWYYLVNILSDLHKNYNLDFSLLRNMKGYHKMIQSLKKNKI